MRANKPDIVVEYRSNKVSILIDMSILCNHNLSAIEFDKLRKYKDLKIEIENMWHLKGDTKSVIVGVRCMMKKGAENHSSVILIYHSYRKCKRLS